MKLLNRFSLIAILLIAVNANLFAYEAIVKGVKPKEKSELHQKYNVNTNEELLKVTPSNFKKETGKKLTFKDVSELKAAQKQIKKDLKKQDKQNGTKSQLVALLLVIFVGVLGIHRFYLGHIGIGIVQLLTGGMCGIWTLIDLIMIITGDLKPKDGSEYDPKL